MRPLFRPTRLAALLLGLGCLAQAHAEALPAVVDKVLLQQPSVRSAQALLRAADADDGSTLRYLAAHPGGSTADPVTLIREVHGVVLSQEPQVQDAQNLARGQHSQATIYRVQWTMTVTRPYAYSPPVDVAVDWDETTLDPIGWIHGADCKTPASCADMPVFFAEGCDVERIEAVTTPPPTCGGCMPVCAVQTRVFQLPTFDSPYRCRQTAVTLRVRNNSGKLRKPSGRILLCRL